MCRYEREYTSEHISKLKEHEIFVFGSNLQGYHGGGAALIAMNSFGALWGQGVGLQGQCYAIPTMHGGLAQIKPYVDDFILFAKEHSQFKFLVTRIGCGIAGFKDEQIATLFKEALPIKNIILPKEFVEALQSKSQQSQARPCLAQLALVRHGQVVLGRAQVEMGKLGIWQGYAKSVRQGIRARW